MFKKHKAGFPESRKIKKEKIVYKVETESSSEDEVKSSYIDLVFLVKDEGRLTSSDTDSASDNESVINPKRAKICQKASSDEIDSELSEKETVDSDSVSDRDCLMEESGSEHENNDGKIAIFGDSDSEDYDGHQSNPGTDYFKQHINADVSEPSDIEKCKPQLVRSVQWSRLQSLRHTARESSAASSIPAKPISKNVTQEDLKNTFHVRKILVENWVKVNHINQCKQEPLFTPLQRELFTLFNHYVDVCYSDSGALKSCHEIHRTYCLHVANHVLRSRAKVRLNSARLKQMSAERREQVEYRDQGITRPKVLILLPFKHTALKVVDTLIELLRRGKKFEVGYKKRFYEEFGTDEGDFEALEKKPEDHQNLFTGNTDEHFRVGIALLRNSVRLYAPFYSSDIIVASPLGLRTIIGADGEKHYEHDFLSSVEIVVMDHTDVFLMQNWEHVLHIFEHLNLTPKDSHGVDFSRVRNFSLDGLSKFYRQTISVASVSLPQISSLFSKLSWNHKGCCAAESSIDKGSICAIAKQLPQVFHKLVPASLVESAEMRFRFFIEKIYKQYRDSKLDHTVIYVPQYFDFVRLRNFMRKEWKSGAGPIFAHINDYSSPSEAGKAKRRFFTGKCPVMLYTERFHFYNRAKIRGMKNLVFYELPTYPQFYSELCNMIRETDNGMTAGNSGSVIVMYSKYETRKLMATVGLSRCRELQASSKTVHMFVTGPRS